MESELVIEDVHSFSMFVWSGSSSKAVITCGLRHNARFEFRNVSYGGRQLPFKSDISHPTISNPNISNFKISNSNISDLVSIDR